MTDADPEMARLRSENQRLVEELLQAKSDKEFVWSLWKRLQVASPDLTQAISMVVQREKEKAETKDAKVLQLLQLKDTKIDELQEVVTKQSRELSLAIQKKAELVDRVKRAEADLITSTDQVKQLNERLRTLDSGAEERRRQTVEEYERQQRELSEKVTTLQVELTRVKSEAGDLQATKIALESRSTLAERELARLRSDAGSSREEAARALSRAQADSERLRSELEERKEEAARLMARLEASQDQLEQQSALMNKLEAMEQNKEKILRSRERSLSKNSKELTRQIAVLKAQNRALKGRPGPAPKRTMTNLATGDGLDSTGEEEGEEEDGIGLRMRHCSAESEGPVVDLGYRMERLQRQVRLLEDNLRRREGVIRSLKEAAVTSKVPRRSPGAYVRQNRTTRLRARSAPLRASRRCLHHESLQKQLAAADRHASELEKEVSTRDEEVCALRQEADRRSQRILALRSQLRRNRSTVHEAEAMTRELSELRAAFREVSSANKTLEEQLNRVRTKHRHDEETILDLRHRVKHDGDSAAVDGIEKERLSQELDQLRVQLRLASEQRSLEDRRANDSMSSAQRAWDAERRGLRAELQTLAEELSAKRLKVSSLERELERHRDVGRSGAAMAGILEHFAAAEEAERAAEEKVSAATTAEENSEREEETTSTAREEPSSARRSSHNAILRRRLTALQNQLRSVRKSRSHLTAGLSSMQQRNRQLAQELEAANARCNRLRGANNNALVSDAEEGATPRRKENTEEAKRLREEVTEKDGRISELREKLTRSERDVAQKRTLLEELRSKLRSAQEASKSDKEATESAAQRIRELAEASERQRVQLESQKRRLAAVTAERKRLDAEANALRAEAERKGKAAGEASARRSDAERKLAAAEKAQEEKMNALVRRSEAAVSGAREKVAETQARAMRAQRLLLRLCRALSGCVTEVRRLVADSNRQRVRQEVDSSGESMRAARERAADILNLSLEDVDNILSPARRAQANLADEEWLYRCERCLKEGEGAFDDAAADSLWRCLEEKLAQVVTAVQAAAGITQA